MDPWLEWSALSKKMELKRRWLADTSSIIVMDRLLLREFVLPTFELVVVPGVHTELGPQGDFAIVEAPRQDAPTDIQIVEYASSTKTPVLSEDRKILRAVKERGLPACDCLLLALHLKLKGTLPALAWERVLSVYRTDLRAREDYMRWVEQVLQMAQKFL